MSYEQTKQASNYMSQLDAWTEDQVIRPLAEVLEAYYQASEEDRQSDERYDKSLWHTDALVKKAIREKVLESYHNGQKAMPQKGRTWKK